MIDRPDLETLLGAMAATLSNEVVPASTGVAQHAARVVANLCLILQRETALGAGRERDASKAVAALLGGREEGETLGELSEALERRIMDCDDAFAEEVRRVLLEDARRRLTIDRPGYAP